MDENKPDIQRSYTLAMLGTDTHYTPELKTTKTTHPLKKGDKTLNYPKGETLSIVSTLIHTQHQAQINHKSPVPYKADDVAVVNGPDTYGRNVGEKIGIGLGETLLAIARGQNTINIIAHSRGAVESILIAHELQTIQEIIESCQNIDAVFEHLTTQQTERHHNKKPRNNTPDIINHLKMQLQVIDKEEQENWFQALKNHIPALSINFFGIDPVPGDCFPVTWYDNRFFTLPPVVKNAEIIYYENEHSDWGFTPIHVEITTQQQKLIQYTMPGHHGTGSTGNNASQQNYVVASPPITTTHVQKLIIYKLLNFLNRHGVSFHNPALQLFKEHAALGRKYITLRANTLLEEETIKVSLLDFPAIYRKLYEKIAENRKEGYEKYNKTHYTFMGVSSQRKLLRKEHTYGVLTDIFPIHTGFVNKEHADLMTEHFFKMFKMFKLDQKPTSLASIVNDASKVLEENINPVTQPLDSLNNNFILLNNQRKNLSDKATRDIVTKTFTILIQQVSSQYLTDNWNSAKKQQEKKQLFNAIIHILEKFNELSHLDEPTISLFVKELNELSITGIADTLEQQYRTLNKNIERVQEPIDLKLQQFFRSLTSQITQNDQIIDTSQIAQIINSTEYEQLPNFPLNLKISYIFERLDKIAPETVAKIKKHVECHRDTVEVNKTILIDEFTKSFEEQYNDNFGVFITLCQQIQVFINDLNALSSLVPDKSTEFGQYIEKLHERKQHLIKTAIERFYHGKTSKEKDKNPSTTLEKFSFFGPLINKDTGTEPRPSNSPTH